MHENKTPLRVLIVEDFADTREHICGAIREVSCPVEIVAVASESDAVDRIVTEFFDAVILDLQLREGTGFGVLRRVKSKSTASQVIVVTNYALPSYREYSRLLGAEYFLDKAVDLKRVTEILDAINLKRSATSL